MKILFCGDVVGRSGRDVIMGNMPYLKKKLSLDFVVVNGENAAHGFGITAKFCEEFFKIGVDVITLGNHTWDQKEIISYINTQPKLIRPLNYPEGLEGKGYGVFETSSGKKVLVVQVMGRLFLDPIDCPFKTIEKIFEKYPLGRNGISAVIVDFHAEATSEKVAFGHFCDGRASLVVGTHTHIPTADLHILSKGTAYMTDVGMCGDYDSVIGMQKEEPINRFVKGVKLGKLVPATEEGTFCGVYVETDDKTGLATRVKPIRIGGKLQPTD
ncbi:MAG: TIGR00282 family metallophosphoesterase [Alphaproteobacteria bacterium]